MFTPKKEKMLKNNLRYEILYGDRQVARSKRQEGFITFKF